MAASMCRMRPLFQTLFNEKRILFSNLVSRTYITPSLNYVTTFKHQFLQNGVVVRCQERVLNGSALNIRFFSSGKKLSTEEISEKVLHICKTFDKIPGDKLTLEAHFMNDLGLDSLDHVELIMNIEDDFDFEIPDGDAEKLLRPRDIVAYIEQKEQVK